MKTKSKLLLALFLTLLLLTVGILGYSILGEYTFIEAFYMTVITISSVGFGEVHPPNDAEKLFTIFLILTSITIFGYIVSVVTEFLVNGKLLAELKFRNVQKKIKKLQGHTIVCGFGRNGRQAVAKLIDNNESCVVIEKDPKIIANGDVSGVLCINGDATEDKYLEIAGIKEAKNLIVALPSDADNLYVVLSAKQFNDKLTIISRASKETSERKLKIAGATNVIMPDRIGGDYMASLVVFPNIIEFVDKLSRNGDCDTYLREIEVNKLPSKFQNKNLMLLDLRKTTGCSVIGYKSPENEYIINPEPETELIPDSKLIVLGRKEQINKLQELF